MNILITNIGRRGYLTDFVRHTKNFKGNIYVSDCDKTASGLYSDVNGSFILPKPVDDEEEYVKKLLEICLEYSINLIIPVIDPEIYILSKYRDYFKNQGIIVLVSGREVLDICYDKIKMNHYLEKNNFFTVKTYYDVETFDDDLEQNKINFPVFVKPILGSGSIKSEKINDHNSLNAFFEPNLIIQEYIDGVEYGVDSLVNDGKVLRVVVKEKISMRSGETDKAITVYNDVIMKEVKRLMTILKPFGSVDCDVILKDNKPYIIDINPRFGGGYPATHLSGVNFIELIINILNNELVMPEFNTYKVGQLVMKDVGLKVVSIDEKKCLEM